MKKDTVDTGKFRPKNSMQSGKCVLKVENNFIERSFAKTQSRLSKRLQFLHRCDI